jgi:hypothetical protein
MKSSIKRIVEIKEDGATIQIEIEKSIIDFYQKETGRKRITAKGLSQFFNRLIQNFNH